MWGDLDGAAGGTAGQGRLPAAHRCPVLVLSARSKTSPHAPTSFMVNYCNAGVAQTILTSPVVAMTSKGGEEVACYPYF